MNRPVVEVWSEDKQVSRVPALVYGVWLTTTSQTKYIRLYDGHGTDGTLRLWLSSSDSSVAAIVPKEPIPFNEGIYLDVESDKCVAMIQYRSLGSKDKEL